MNAYRTAPRRPLSPFDVPTPWWHVRRWARWWLTSRRRKDGVRYLEALLAAERLLGFVHSHERTKWSGEPIFKGRPRPEPLKRVHE